MSRARHGQLIAGLLPRLWVEPEQSFRCLTAEAQWWIDDLRAHTEGYLRHNAQDLLELAIDALESLGSTQGEQVLIHQDMHGDNILAAQREP